MLFVFLSFLDHLRSQLSERFQKQSGPVELLSSLLPHNITTAAQDIDLERIATLCGEIYGEAFVWKQK